MFEKLKKFIMDLVGGCPETDNTALANQILGLKKDKIALEEKVASLETEIGISDAKNVELEQINADLRAASILKDEEIAALNTKLNTYTMDEAKMLERLNANVYLWKPQDITLDPGEKIELGALVTVMNGYGARALTYIDNYYFSIEKDKVEALLAQNTAIDKSQYIAEVHDCDDFAFALKGMFSQQALSRYAFGWARSSNHAFNFFLDSFGTVWIVEPQNSNIMKYDDVLANQTSTNGQESGLDYKITSYLI